MKIPIVSTAQSQFGYHPKLPVQPVSRRLMFVAEHKDHLSIFVTQGKKRITVSDSG